MGHEGSRTPLRLPVVREGAGFLPSLALNSVGVPEIQVLRRETTRFPELICKKRGRVRGWGAAGLGVSHGEQAVPWLLPGERQSASYISLEKRHCGPISPL